MVNYKKFESFKRGFFLYPLTQHNIHNQQSALIIILWNNSPIFTSQTCPFLHTLPGSAIYPQTS